MRWVLVLATSLLFSMENEKEALLLRRIADFWQEGEYQIAKTQIEEFIVEYPESPFADALCAALGDLFLREKNFSHALNYYSQVQSPEFIQKVFLNRMQCLYEMQWYATLVDECEAHLNINPDPQATYFLAIALYQQCINAAKESEQRLVFAQKAKPYFETLYQGEFSQEIAQGYAYLCCILQEYAKATEIYSDLAKKYPSMEEEMLFQVALIQAEYDKPLALTTFEKLGKMQGKQAKESVYNWMVLAFELGHYEELLSKDLLKQIPSDRVGVARLFVGRSLLHMARYAEAALELKAYIAHAPLSETLVAALLSLLDASYQTGDLATLDETTAKLAAHYPESPELPKAYFSRAQLLKKSERLQEAKAEWEKLLDTFPKFAQKPQVIFELTHLDYKSKDWAHCYARGLSFLHDFVDHELSPFVWRYVVSSSAEIAMQNPEHKPQLIKDLHLFLQLPLQDVEKEEWQLLLAKTYYELRDYPAAIQCLQSQNTSNAKLLLALCYRDSKQDFLELAEEALQKGANLIDLGQIHASLYNTYLELGAWEKAAEHLYEAFMAKAEIKLENLLWLADHYFQKVLEEEGNFVLAARTAALLDRCKCKAALHSQETDSVICKLAKVYSILGKLDEAIALLEPLSSPSYTAQLLLGEVYAKKGKLDRALDLFDAVIAAYGTGRSPIAASASLQAAKIRRLQGSTHFVEVATALKNLVIQKNFEGEPTYLEAALEYVDLTASEDPVKRKALLQKTKGDFEETSDLLSKDYHAMREKSPRKNSIYQGYMKLIDAEIGLAEAQIDRSREKELRLHTKTLLQDLLKQPLVPSLKERVEKLLSHAT